MMLRSLHGLLIAALATVALTIAGCAGDDSTRSFQKQAFALGETYIAVQKGAIIYLQTANPSQATKDKINAADDKAAPMVKDVLSCAKSLSAPPPPPPATAVELGLSGEDAAEAECQGKLSQALAAVNDFRDAVKGE